VADSLSFEEAVAQEAWERAGAYVDAPSLVCGVPIRQATPLDWARLGYARNPFAVGGIPSHPACAQFLFLLRADVETSERKARKRMTQVTCDLAMLPLSMACEQIEEYLAITFRDSSGGSAHGAPIAISTAWMEYRMQVTFGWPSDRTLNTSMRRIFALVRCWQKEQGEIVTNKLSHGVEDERLRARQKAIDDAKDEETFALIARSAGEFQPGLN